MISLLSREKINIIISLLIAALSVFLFADFVYGNFNVQIGKKPCGDKKPKYIGSFKYGTIKCVPKGECTGERRWKRTPGGCKNKGKGICCEIRTREGQTLKQKYNKQTSAFQGKKGAEVSNTEDPRAIIAMLIKWGLTLVGIIALGYAIYGGYLIMSSRGNEEKLEDGKSTLLTASIGVLIILASYGITNFVLDSMWQASKPACDPTDPVCIQFEVNREPTGEIQQKGETLPPQDVEEKRWGWSF